jgi:hypothetical protein
MALPDLNESGDLPVGVYPATLSEVMDRFGRGTVRRIEVATRLERIWHLALGTQSLARFVVFGSFVSDKPEPNDVDVVLVMADDFDAKLLSGEVRLLFEHGTAQSHFGASVFWYPESASVGSGPLPIERWQIKRDRTLRGIVEIVEDDPS